MEIIKIGRIVMWVLASASVTYIMFKSGKDGQFKDFLDAKYSNSNRFVDQKLEIKEHKQNTILFAIIGVAVLLEMLYQSYY